jgi:DNA-binding transcriptional LysR family regulator
MVITLAQRGLGPAILALSMTEGLHAVRITDPSPWSRLGFAWRSEGPRSPAARALIRLAEKHVTPDLQVCHDHRHVPDG